MSSGLRRSRGRRAVNGAGRPSAQGFSGILGNLARSKARAEPDTEEPVTSLEFRDRGADGRESQAEPQCPCVRRRTVAESERRFRSSRRSRPGPAEHRPNVVRPVFRRRRIGGKDVQKKSSADSPPSRMAFPWVMPKDELTLHANVFPLTISAADNPLFPERTLMTALEIASLAVASADAAAPVVAVVGVWRPRQRRTRATTARGRAAAARSRRMPPRGGHDGA